MKVKANFDYNDILLERLVKKDEVIEVDEERGKLLTTKLYNGVPFCDVVEEQQGQEENDGEEPKEPLDEAPKENMEEPKEDLDEVKEPKEEKVEAPKENMEEPKEDLDEVKEPKEEKVEAPKKKRTRKAKVEE